MSFLDNQFYIPWSSLTPDRLVGDMRAALSDAQQKIDALAKPSSESLTFQNTLLALESAAEDLGKAWGKASHLDSVCNSPELREAYNEVLPEVSDFFSSIHLNAGLWQRLKSYSETEEAKNLTGIQRRFLEETMADFVESGADLDDEQKSRLLQIEADLAATTQKFGENVLDSTNAWELVIDDETMLAGLPPTAKETARQSALAQGYGSDEQPVWRFTLHAPSMLPVLEHVHDKEVRREIWTASSQVGRTGENDNRELIKKILRLRQEKAELLGEKNFADLVTKRRMAKSGQAALDFGKTLFQKTMAAFERDCQELAAFRQEKSGEHGLMEPWDIAYWAEKLRAEHFAFDDELLRPYFPIDGVINGMFSLAAELFGILIEQKSPGPDAEVWHPDVKLYDLFDATTRCHLGSFYADWHPRASKRSGAWMNHLHTGHCCGQESSPHLGLICGNLTPPTKNQPALLTHDEVSTIFHEFGHLLHHLLGEVEIRSLNGIHVAWDFVELPSQLMENFCWERKSLDYFARHFESGATIPDDLLEKVRAARTFRAASAQIRQLALAKLDLELHIDYAKCEPFEIDALSAKITEGYRIPTNTQSPSMAPRFTHLFASSTGYAAGYYSYKWAEVLDADAFEQFLQNGVVSPEIGLIYRKKILSQGNAKPPEQLFRDFRGRDPEIDPLLKRFGLLSPA